MDKKFDFNDISLIPCRLSNVRSRNNINFLIDNKLPLFVSPMDTVIDETNYSLFMKLGFNVCIPRGIKETFEDECFISYGLDEIEEIIKNSGTLPKRCLIDVANAHSIRVYETAKKIKKKYSDIELMIGNIANPLTFKDYCKIGVDAVRVGIGAGHACTTSANSSIHYPMASLIKECYEIKRKGDYKTKIVADGGFKNFDDIIKAIGLGADSVMLGNIINRSIESCAQNFILNGGGTYLAIDKEAAIEIFKDGGDIFKTFRGMSTKEVQKKWGKKELRTSEGIVKFNKVEYTIGGWVENFIDYLKSCMSYQGKDDIKNFIGQSEYVFITPNSYERFNK
jgi:IMP dehydrogenase/GMP reductase